MTTDRQNPPPDQAAEIAALQARIAVLEASIAGLRRAALVDKRREIAPMERPPELPPGRAFRVVIAYYSLFGHPLIGRPLVIARRAAGRVVRVIRSGVNL